MERVREVMMDGTSRLLSVLGIVIGAGGVAYLYQANQALKNQVSQLPAAVTDAEKFNKEWNGQLTTALEEFKSRANDRIAKFDAADAERDLEFQQRLSRMAVDEELVAGLVDKKFREFEQIASRPNLHVAENLLKPASGEDANLITIRNQGLEDAKLTLVTFRPTAQFEITSPVSVDTKHVERILVRFLPSDNTATEPGLHHHYVRQLDGELVPGNSYVRLLIEIENAKHEGWGLEGELDLKYADDRVLTIPNVRADFVAGPDDSI